MNPNRNPGLVRLWKKLCKEYEETLVHEQDLWRPKSRIIWLKEGERNSKKFHVSTLVRRKRNKITSIINTHDEVIHNQFDIEEELANHFEKMFASSKIMSPISSPLDERWNTVISPEDQEALSQPISDLEIKRAIFQIHPQKTPGPDGLHSSFFQKMLDCGGE